MKSQSSLALTANPDNFIYYKLAVHHTSQCKHTNTVSHNGFVYSADADADADFVYSADTV